MENNSLVQTDIAYLSGVYVVEPHTDIAYLSGAYVAESQCPTR